MAGFQSKGTLRPSKNFSKSSVKIGNHAQYWANASMPIFVVSTDAISGKILVEDTGSLSDLYNLISRHAKAINSIPTDVTLDFAAVDIRLRMYSCALAPWISRKIRSRPLAHSDADRGLNPQSTWALLDYASGPNSSFPVANTWSEIRQYYLLLSYLMDDEWCLQQLEDDLKVATDEKTLRSLIEHENEAYADTSLDKQSCECWIEENGQPSIGLIRMLAGSIELFTRFPNHEPARRQFVSTPRIAKRIRDLKGNNASKNSASKSKTSVSALSNEFLDPSIQISDLEDPHFGLLRQDLDSSIEIIIRFWELCSGLLGFGTKDLAMLVDSFSKFINISTSTTDVLDAVISGRADLRTALRFSIHEHISKDIYRNHWNDVIGKKSIL